MNEEQAPGQSIMTIVSDDQKEIQIVLTGPYDLREIDAMLDVAKAKLGLLLRRIDLQQREQRGEPPIIPRP